MSEIDFVPKQRVGITMDVGVLSRVDDYASKNGISRSGAISVLVNQALATANALEGINELNTMMKELQKLAEENEVKTSEIEK